MITPSTLNTAPPLSPEAKELTNALTQQLHTTIEQQGPISFSQYMQQALYNPQLGYYMGGQIRFGQRGDFVTAPLISPLFGKVLALFLHNNCSSTQILELGAGDGTLATQILSKLEQLQSLPSKYYILEVSAALQQEQQRTLTKHCPHLIDKIHWLKTLPQSFSGTIIANEVFDALPIDCFIIKKNQILERCVTIKNKQLTWATRSASTSLINKINQLSCTKALTTWDGYSSEINVMLSDYIKTIASILTPNSYFLCFDYGYLEEQYYHPQRIHGTLSTHYQHVRLDNPLLYPGLQDITAHVNFSQVLKAANTAHLSTELFTSQADFLLNHGLLEAASAYTNQDGSLPRSLSQAIHTLTDPARMGDVFKVLFLKK